MNIWGIPDWLEREVRGARQGVCLLWHPDDGEDISAWLSESGGNVGAHHQRRQNRDP